MASTVTIRSNTKQIIEDVKKRLAGMPGVRVESYKELIREAAKDAADKYTEQNFAYKKRSGALRYESPPGADIAKKVSVVRAGRRVEYFIPMYYSKMVASRSGDTRESIEAFIKDPLSDQKEISIDLVGNEVDISFTPKVKALEMGAYNKKTGARRRKRPYLYQSLTAYQKAIKFLEKKFGDQLGAN